MKPLLLFALAAYVVAAIHALLAFANKRRTLERMTLSSLAVGFTAHTLALVIDWAQEGHYPLFGLRETLSFLAWTLVIGHALAFYRYRAQALASFILPLVAVLVFIAGVTRNNATDAPGATPLVTDSAWLFPAHTTLLIFAYASFFIVFVAGVMYLLQERELKAKSFGAIFHRLPSLATVDEIGSASAGIGFTLLTLGIMTGMIWSAARDSVVWRNDPKEIFALLTWLLYLALVHYRYTDRLRGRKAAWIGVAGFVLVLCTFFGARLMGSYHVFG